MLIGFLLPALAGFIYDGWVGALGGFLISGIARVVTVQHCTFFINSACHCLGRQPYSTRCSARDSLLLAFFTFGEGYHNYHHEFQHDYRNGVKPWQIDPTKWLIWTLSRFGLVSKLRRVSREKILLAELAETQRLLKTTLARPGLTEGAATYIASAYHRLQETAQKWKQRKAEQFEVTREMLAELRNEIRTATSALQLLSARMRGPA